MIIIEIMGMRSIVQNISKKNSTYFKQLREKLLAQLIEKNKNAPAQGTPEWLKGRILTFGGSEISTLTGDNPYSNIKTLIASKVGLYNFKGNLFTRWGNAFEDITKKITEKIFNTIIYNTGSISGSITEIKYSPDGIATVRMLCEGNDGRLQYEYLIILFEFKALYTKMPMGVIPKHYIPQVKTGLCSIPIVHHGIYVSNTYRICSIEQFDTGNRYNTRIHYTDAKLKEKNGAGILKKVKHPIALGFIYVYINLDTYNTEYKKEHIINQDAVDNTTGNANPDEIIADFSESADEDDVKEDYDIDVPDCLDGINTSDGDSSEEIDSDIEDQTIDWTHKDIVERLAYIANRKHTRESDIIDIGRSESPSWLDSILEYSDSRCSDKASILEFGYSDICTLDREINKIPFVSAQNNVIMNPKPNEQKLREFIKEEDTMRKSIFAKNTKTRFLVAIIPWKLMISDIIFQEKDIKYREVYEPHVIKNSIIVKDILFGYEVNGETRYSTEKNDMYSIAKRFRKYFPEKNTSLDRHITDIINSQDWEN